MKIAIITIFGEMNYGNRLQNYSMQIVLEKIFPYAEILTIKNKVYDHSYLKIRNNQKKQSVKRIIKKIYNIIDKVKLNNNEYKCANAQRKNNFCDFNKHIKFIEILNENYEEIFNDFDLVIVGSDQVWNPYFGIDDKLVFAPYSSKNKNIAIAASIGVENIEDCYLDFYRNGLVNFKSILVRENAASQIVDSIINQKAEVILDPTMMLTKEEWIVAESKVVNLPKNYIVTCFLNDYPKWIKKIVKEYADERKLEIVDLNNKNMFKYYSYGPAKFINVMHNAKFVFTNSFHTAVFSIIFEKEFLVFGNGDNNENMNSRIDTLLGYFNLQNRFIAKNNFKEELINTGIDYRIVRKILQDKRTTSFGIIKENIYENGD